MADRHHGTVSKIPFCEVFHVWRRADLITGRQDQDVLPLQRSGAFAILDTTEMHELSVTQSALEAALLRAGAAQITGVHLAIGTVSAIEPESIRFYWDQISEGTLAEGAVLHFQRVPTESVCTDCGHRFVVEAEVPPCPACRGLHVSAIDDEYLGLAALDVEKRRVVNAHE